MMSIAGTLRRRYVNAIALALALFLAWPILASAEEQAGAAGAEETGAARAHERSGESAVPFNGSKGVDAIAVRPTTFLMSLVSSGAFLVSLPFAALDPAIGVGKAREDLVNYPFNDTFQRPLGDLDGMGDPSVATRSRE